MSFNFCSIQTTPSWISLLVISALAILFSVGISQSARASSSDCTNTSIRTTANIHAGPDSAYSVIQVASPDLPVCPTAYNHDLGVVWVKLTNGGWIQRDLIQNAPGGLSYESAPSVPASGQSVHITMQATVATPSTSASTPSAYSAQPIVTAVVVEPSPSTTTVAPVVASNCNGGCVTQPSWCASPIKGNISYKTGEKIYHVVGGQYYSRTKMSPGKGERWFCTESEAMADGWRRSMR